MSERTKTSKTIRRVVRPASLLTVLTMFAGLMAYGLPRASAQSTCVPGNGNCAAAYSIVKQQIQEVGNSLKLQARISQAKMPVGEAVFNNIYVAVKETTGGQALCSATFSKVRVVDSVLNLDLGSKFDCQLDDLIARSGDLMLQVCIENTTNCLKPIEMSTVPYAIKSTYARTAQEAFIANVAAQCNYAHRVTADASLFDSNGTLGTGYFDFYTPTNASVAGSGFPSLTGKEGVIKWAPVDPNVARSKTVYIVGQEPNGAMMSLDALYIGAKEARLASGAKVYMPNATFEENMTFVADRTVSYLGTVDMSSAQSVKLPPTIQSSVSYSDGAAFAATGKTVGGSSSAVTGGVIRVRESDTNATLVVDADEFQTTLASGAPAALTVQRMGGDFIVGANRLKVTAAGQVSIGDVTNIEGGLHVVVGSDITANAGGRIVVGVPNGQEIAIDENEIQARNSSNAPSGLFFNLNGGIIQTGPGAFGIGAEPTEGGLYVANGSVLGAAGGGVAVFGTPNGEEVAVDGNEIQARTGANNAASILHLNARGGEVRTGADLTVKGEGRFGDIGNGSHVYVANSYIGGVTNGLPNDLWVNTGNFLYGGDTYIGTWGTMKVSGMNTGFGVFGIQNSPTPRHKTHVFADSNTTYVHGMFEEMDDDYARIGFKNSATSHTFQVAAKPNPTDSSAWMHFWYGGSGNLMSLRGDGQVYVTKYATGYTTAMCTSSSGSGYLGRCSSSRRYKDDIRDLTLGLKTVQSLRPVTFKLKATGEADLGFVAEEVEKIDPIMTIKNEKGQVETVRYQQLTAVLTKAVQEQQAQIAAQQEELKELRSLVCAMQPEAAVCKAKPNKPKAR